MPPQQSPAALAAALVVAGGSGTAADVAAVRPEIAKLPADILTFLIGKKARVVACRGSVTDVETALRGVVPRGWENLKPRRTWDSVPGTYLAKGKRVIVATTATAAGGRKVPDMGAGHGSANLALHETLHGRHRLADSVLKAKGFKQARQADFARLPDYLRQEGVAGLEETYAESGARFFQRDPKLAAEWPALFAFWSGAPIPPAPAGGGSVLASFGGAGARAAASTAPAIGTAEMDEDGTITLDLRAVRRGALGHAFFVVRRGDPDYEEVRAQHFPGRRGASVLASLPAGPRSVLIPASGG
jgi:toxin lethal factor